MPNSFQSGRSPQFVSASSAFSLGIGSSNTAKWMAAGSAWSVTLTPGQWMVHAWYILSANAAVTYGQNRIGWFGAQGTGTTVPPAPIDSVAGFSLCAGTGLTNSLFIVPAASGDNVTGAGPTIRINSVVTAPLFFGICPQGTTLGQAFAGAHLYAEKLD